MGVLRKRVSVIAVFVVMMGAVAMAASPADARCRTMRAGYNGTDMFNGPGGAAMLARDRLRYSIDDMKRTKRLKRVRVSRIRTKCGEWFMKYLLPHRHCQARAQVCY